MRRRLIWSSAAAIAVLIAVSAIAVFVVAPEFRAKEAKENITACVEAGDYEKAIGLVDTLEPSDYEKISSGLGMLVCEETNTFLRGITPDNCLESSNFEKAEALKALTEKLGFASASDAQSSLELYLKLEEFAQYEPFIEAICSQEMEDYLDAVGIAASSLESYAKTGVTGSLSRVVEKMDDISFERFGLDNYGISRLEEHRADFTSILREIADACAMNQREQLTALLNDLSQKTENGLDLVEEADELMEEKSQMYDEFQNSLR